MPATPAGAGLGRDLGPAVRHLAAGGVLVHPTEAVWGLAADPDDAAAVDRVLALKQRPMAKGLILVADHPDRFGHLLAGLAVARVEEIRRSWPGPVTWVVPDPQGLVPPWVTGGRGSVAIRVSAHPGVVALCAAFGGALVSTSANPSGRPPARTALAVRRYFRRPLANGVLRLVPGDTDGLAAPSEIRDACSAKVLRPGGPGSRQ